MKSILSLPNSALFGPWERETYRAISSAAQTAEFFVDIGAGKGELCAFFATLEGIRRIVAIEPDEVETMSANLNHNEYSSWPRRSLEKVCWHEERCRSHREVDAPTQFRHVVRRLIKIDVDGSEFDVLQSGKTLFSEGKVEVLVETHSFELEKNCLGSVTSARIQLHHNQKCVVERMIQSNVRSLTTDGSSLHAERVTPVISWASVFEQPGEPRFAGIAATIENRLRSLQRALGSGVFYAALH